MGENLSGVLFPTCPLERGEWGACVAAGATPLLIAALLKLSPESWVTRIKVDKFVDENVATENSLLLKKFTDAKNTKVKIPEVNIKVGGSASNPESMKR